MGKATDILLVTPGHEDFGMVLIALSHVVILLELLVGLVIIGKNIRAIERALHTKMVVGSPGEPAVAVARLNQALGKSNGGRNTIAAHLLHRILRILVDVLLS